MSSKYKEVLNGLAVLVLILGIIGSIVLAYNFGVDTRYSYYLKKTITERNAGLTFVYFIAGTFVTCVQFVIMKALAECLEFLENARYTDLEQTFTSATKEERLPEL